MKYEGFLFVLVGPSGAGKNAIINKLLREQNPGNLRQLTTVTTRPKRENETEGREHYFVSQPRFEELVEADALIEYQLIHKKWYYGTPQAELESAFGKGEHLIADIDVLGAKALKNAFPENVTLVFIAPPNTSVLEARIRERSTDTEEQIQTRLERAALEMGYVPVCDFVVINDDLEHATSLVKEIISARREGQTMKLAAHAWIRGEDGVLTHSEKLPCTPVENREGAANNLKTYLREVLGVLAEPIDGNAAWYHHTNTHPFVDIILPMRAVQVPDKDELEWQPSEQIEISLYLKEMMAELKPTFG